MTDGDASGPLGAPGSSGQLRRQLSVLGAFLLTLSCLSPVLSIYGVGADVLQHAGSGAAGLFVLAVLVAVIWAVIYAELGSAYPCAGGDYVAVGATLGPWAGFASLTIWTVTAGPMTAYLALTIATYVGDFAPDIPSAGVTFGSLAAALGFAFLATRTSARITGLFLAVELIAVVVLLRVGFAHPARSLAGVLAHPLMPLSSGALVPATVGVMALAGVNAAYATAGAGQAIAFGEELTDARRQMGRVVMLAGVLGALLTALPVIAVVVGAGDLAAIVHSPAPFSAYIAAAAGPAAGRALSAVVALAVFNALIAQLMYSARLFYSLGRDQVFPHRLNRLLATVHGRSGSPRYATLVLGAISAACCLVDTHVLLVFLSGLVVYSLALASLAALVGRHRRLTGMPGYWRAPWHPLAPALGLALALLFGSAQLLDADVGRPSLLLLTACMGLGLLWYRFVVRPGCEHGTPRLG